MSNDAKQEQQEAPSDVLGWIAKQSAIMIGTIPNDVGVQIHWLPTTNSDKSEPVDWNPHDSTDGWRHAKGAKTLMDAFLAAMKHDRRVSLGLIQEVELRAALSAVRGTESEQ